MSLKDIGNDHYHNRNYAKAIEYYLKHIEANPTEASGYNNLAMSQWKLQRYEECLASCDEAIRLDPKYKKVIFRRMQTYTKLGRFLETILDAQRYLELEDPKE